MLIYDSRCRTEGAGSESACEQDKKGLLPEEGVEIVCREGV